VNLSLEIARRVNAIDIHVAPEPAYHWAKAAITDLLGVALAGADTAAPRTAAHALGLEGNSGPCRIWGRTGRTGMLDAALINGTAAHALDFDDSHRLMTGHPSATLIPALMALAETLHRSGRDLLEAYLSGFETAAHMGHGLNAVNFCHYAKGWHPTATIGTFAAATACGRLLRLDDSQLATAIGICASLASGVKSNFGTMTKPLHAGLAARNGLFAALLAQAGFTAAPDALEHPQGFFEVFNGPGAYDVQPILGDWAATWQILDPGVSIKQFPCCYSLHSITEAAIAIKAAHDVVPEEIDRVEACLHQRRLAHTQRPATDGLAAKFSYRYVVARGLIEGGLRLEHFEGQAHAEPRVVALMERVNATAHHDDENDLAGYLTVRLTDGRVFEHAVMVPQGRNPRVPLPPEALRRKFDNCAGRLLTREEVDCLYSKIQNLETLENVTELSAILASKQTRPAAG
jgi:2-methylcitrate dehydratase PrpD